MNKKFMLAFVCLLSLGFLSGCGNKSCKECEDPCELCGTCHESDAHNESSDINKLKESAEVNR